MQEWNNYSIIIQLDDKTEAYKKAMFLHAIGSETLKIVNTLNLPADTKLEEIILKLESHFIGELNETYERYKFNQRTQQEGESVTAYVTALRHLAKTCNFCDCLKDTLLRDRILIGIRCANTRKRLLQERNLDLKKCIDICKSTEASASHLKDIRR